MFPKSDANEKTTAMSEKKFDITVKPSDFDSKGKLNDDALLREQGKNPYMKKGHNFRAKDMAEDLLQKGERVAKDNQMVVTLEDD